MRIEVDLDLCQGHAECAMEAPDVFTVPGHGKVTVVDPEPDDSLRPSVENAVRYCPTQALRIASE